MSGIGSKDDAVAVDADPRRRIASMEENDAISVFHWVGGRFSRAPPPAQKWWERLRRWVKTQATSVQTQGDHVWAFPGALRRITGEVERWSDLWTDQARYCLIESTSGGAFNIFDHREARFVHISHDGISELVIE